MSLPRPRPSLSKRWCFTLNNYTEDEYRSIISNLEANCTYCVVGKEIGESGTPHLQGFAAFTRKYRFQAIKDRYLPRCHLEVARGSPRENRDYCRKDGDYHEFGECPSGSRGDVSTNRSGNRDDVARGFAKAMERGREGLAEFYLERPGAYLFHRSQLLRNFLSHATPIDRPGIEVWWFYGEPGTGKSRKAHEDLPQAYIKDPRTKWWNGYMLESTVIIDDFGPNGIDINHLLRWFDRYKCLVEVKGDMVPLYATKFVVTSNFHPEKLFQFAGECNPQLPALMRRIKLKLFE